MRAVPPGCCVSLLELLCLLPQLFQIVERALFQRTAAVALLRGFHRGKTAAELGIGIAQGDLRLDAEVPREVRGHEKEVADFKLESAGGGFAGADLRFHFVGFFADLVDQPGRLRPVEAAPGCG
jgi:hypothetical protein